MSAVTDPAVENPHAGQGSVLLDIGGSIGAVVIEMPDSMHGVEVEIWPVSATTGLPVPAARSHGHPQEQGHDHHPHVAAVRRPVCGRWVCSLVFAEVSDGEYALVLKGTDVERMRVAVRGGEVTSAAWPG